MFAQINQTLILINCILYTVYPFNCRLSSKQNSSVSTFILCIFNLIDSNIYIYEHRMCCLILKLYLFNIRSWSILILWVYNYHWILVSSSLKSLVYISTSINPVLYSWTINCLWGVTFNKRCVCNTRKYSRFL